MFGWGEEMTDWISTKDMMPPERELVMTKIDDADGARNEGKLKRIGRLWFVPDGNMYVYYRPTHWRKI